MDFKELKKIRSLLTYSQQVFADKLNISKQHYSYLETGKRRITKELELKIKSLPEVKELEKAYPPEFLELAQVMQKSHVKIDYILEAIKADPDRMSLAARVVLAGDKSALEKFLKLS